MKKLIPLLLALVFASGTLQSQNGVDWEERAERIAEKAERIAASFERQAEFTARNWELRAERIAEDFERKYGGEWDIRVNGPGCLEADWCHTFLGIHSDGISKEKARKLGFRNMYGSYVTKVLPGTGAAEAGLLPFDYVFGIDDQRTSDNQDLSDIIADYKPGNQVTLHLVRAGQEMTVKATLGEYREFEYENEGGKAFLGISPDDEEDDDDLDGVTVEVIENTTAASMGLRDGDVITAINGRPILDWDDVTTAVGNLDPGQAVSVNYQRNGAESLSEGTVQQRIDDENWEASKGDDWGWNFETEDYDDEAMEEDEVGGAFLGIYAEKISESKARKLGFDNPYGSYVTGIVQNSGAEKAGLMPFDYIFGIEEYRVGTNQSLGGILRNFEPGKEVAVHFYRKGDKKKVIAKLGTHSDGEKMERNHCQDPFFGIVQVYKGAADGVSIRPVKNSTAFEMGMQENDRITAINGYPMIDWTDITTAIEMLKPGDNIAVEYVRNGEKKKAAKKISSYAEAKKCENCDCDDDDGFSIDVDPNINFSFGGSSPRPRTNTAPRTSPSNLSVKTEDVSAADTDAMRIKGVDMSIENSLRVERFNLSPNASSGMFDLKFNLPSEGKTTVRVYNPVGRVIYDYDLGKFSGDFSDNVDISQNGPGTYYLQVKQGDKTFSRKMVLAKN